MKQKKICYGFTFLEILIATFLLSLAALGLAKMEFSSLHAVNQAFNQTIAAEQLDGMLKMIKQFPNQYQLFYSSWNAFNSKLLLEGFGIIKNSGNQVAVELRWRSGYSYLWKCESTAIKQFSCFSVGVSI